MEDFAIVGPLGYAPTPSRDFFGFHIQILTKSFGGRYRLTMFLRLNNKLGCVQSTTSLKTKKPLSTHLKFEIRKNVYDTHREAEN